MGYCVGARSVRCERGVRDCTAQRRSAFSFEFEVVLCNQAAPLGGAVPFSSNSPFNSPLTHSSDAPLCIAPVVSFYRAG